MGFLKKATPRVEVQIVQSTHGQTFVTWPTNMTASGADLPALPVGGAHPQSRHWVLADKTAVLILNADPSHYPGGVIRHTFNVVQSSWNNRTKVLSSLVEHPSDPDVHFVISTNGKGCNCNQGQAGSAGPIGEPYEIKMVNSDTVEWYTKAGA